MDFSQMAFEDFDLMPWLESVRTLYGKSDPAHDFSHILRVCNNARIIGMQEGADMRVLLLAALLHDLGSEKGKGSKNEKTNEPRSMIHSFLCALGLDEELKEKVTYAVDVHSFSKGIVPITLEARILQDADRLDAIGAIGIARVFLTGGTLGREIYNPEDPFCREREPDDGRWNLDHFYSKLLKLESGMHTPAGRRLAARRTEVLRRYLSDLEEEICLR